MQVKSDYMPQSIPYKCGDKEAPVVTFVANAFLPLDTSDLDYSELVFKRPQSC